MEEILQMLISHCNASLKFILVQCQSLSPHLTYSMLVFL